MSNLTNNTSDLRDILAAVNALPEASGSGGITPSGTKQITANGTYDVTNYASAEVNVPTEEPNIQPLSVTKNGTYTPSGNVDGYGPVTVNVQTAPKLQEKSGANSITPTKSQQTITPDSGYDGLSKVVVDKIPDDYIVPSGTKSITANGSNIDVTNYAKVNVNVPTSGGGGVSATPCTFTINNAHTTTMSIFYTAISGSKIEGQIVVPDNVGQNLTLTNVPKDSFVLVTAGENDPFTVDGDAFYFAGGNEYSVILVSGDASMTFE